jgi:hypothetical protein
MFLSLVKGSWTKKDQARMPPPKPFKEQVETLAEAKGLSISKLGWKAHKPDERGTSQDTLNKALQGKRPLNDPIVEAVAEALEVAPGTFVEYRLSKLRQGLDHRKVGFDSAAKTLLAIEEALRERDDLGELERGIDEALRRAVPSSPSTDASSRSPRRRRTRG